MSLIKNNILQHKKVHFVVTPLGTLLMCQELGAPLFFCHILSKTKMTNRLQSKMTRTRSNMLTSSGESKEFHVIVGLSLDKHKP